MGHISELLHFSLRSITSIDIALSFTALPAWVIFNFLLIKTLRRLIGKKIHKVFKWGCLSFYSLAMVMLFIIIGDYIDSGQHQFSLTAKIILLSINIIAWLLLIIPIVHTYFSIKDISGSNIERMKKNFITLYLILIPTYGILFFSTIFFDRLYFYFMPFLFFTLNFPPLLYLRSRLGKYSLEYSPQTEKNKELDHFFADFNISKTEQRVIQLICEGKSNKEIEDTLFISLQTVKIHIYNIYRKLKIKNRVQLTNLIRGYTEF